MRTSIRIDSVEEIGISEYRGGDNMGDGQILVGSRADSMAVIQIGNFANDDALVLLYDRLASAVLDLKALALARIDERRAIEEFRAQREAAKQAEAPADGRAELVAVGAVDPAPAAAGSDLDDLPF